MELKFAVDTKHRKGWFTGMSFSHPAKMSLPLQLWIIENYTKEGDTILDPMAGSGTILVACSMGRNVIAVELEQKFVDMMHGNWEKIKQRGAQMGYSMGACQIIQGDARQLDNILCDKIITSPPFAGNTGGLRSAESFMYGDDPIGKRMMGGIKGGTGSHPDNIDNLSYGQLEGLLVDKIITSPPYGDPIGITGGDTATFRKKYGHLEEGNIGYSTNPNNLGNLSYGNIDKIITSPPYGDPIGITGGDTQTFRDKYGYTGEGNIGYSKDKNNIGNLSYGDIDAVITSPPYEGMTSSAREDKPSAGFKSEKALKIIRGSIGAYSENENNIGNLKQDNYLSAMLAVYRQCFAVLKSGGLMILVVKNFLREQKEVDLRGDTVKLCEQAGFRYIEERHRILPSQSFWRIIYAQRFPNAPKIDREYVLIFRKEVNND